jgi:energy-coupling factor transporter ATP-binding protein EcfA2
MYPLPFDLSVPLLGGNTLEFSTNVGQTIFILGANGTGKSSLILRLYSAHHGRAHRISAHRQTWFVSNVVTLSAHDKRNTETNMLARDTNIDSRWRDDYSTQRASIAIYDLLDAENVRARKITAAVDGSNFDLAKTLAKKDAPIKIINELLRLSNLPIEISVHESEQIMASKSGGQKYSIAELSDGERNALLIAASVLTVAPGKILFIDEPERHLHRSIISPLLTLLFAHRADCAFVVSTHDVMLPLDNPTARTLLVRGCSYSGTNVTGWDADLVTAHTEIDDDLKRDILGSRRKLLFVEGEDRSLDKPLYSLVFPQVSVIAKSTCRDVEHSVSGIRDAGGLHWLHAFGIVDNDRRSLDDIDALRSKGVYAVSVFSVESIYFHPEIQRRLAERQSGVTGADADALLEAAKHAAIAAVVPHIARLSERVVETTLRQELMSRLPKRSDIAAAQPIHVTIDIPTAIADETTRLQAACDAGDLVSIISRYPIRETPALTQIALKLGFQNPRQYESAVRKLLIDDPNTITFVQGLFGTLAADIAGA